MDIVYPLGTGSVWENNELRYSLRSVAENLSGVRNIYIVGERPDWLQNVFSLPYPDICGVPWRNSFAKILHACTQPDLTEKFLYMNDDFYISKPAEIASWPALSRGNLPAGMRTSRVMSLNRKESTTALLVSQKLTTNDFDIHAPMILEKQKILDLPINPQMPGAFHWRSYYGNYWRVKPIHHDEILVGPRRDLEELRQLLSDKEFFTIMSHAGQDWRVRQYIKTRWATPSKYEK
jgi:hypothetical protein